MIELKWKDALTKDCDIMWIVSSILTWLTGQIATHDDCKDIVLGGFLVIKNRTTKDLSTLLICEDDEYESQKKILKLLQQPPGGYSGRYVAQIVNEEPISVSELQHDDGERSLEKSMIDVEVYDDDDEKG